MSTLELKRAITWKRRSFTRDPDTNRASTTVDSSSTINATVQPAGGAETEFLDEGERTGRELKVYVELSNDVSISDEDSKTPSDLLVIDGDTYKPIKSETYTTVLPHRKLICQRVND